MFRTVAAAAAKMLGTWRSLHSTTFELWTFLAQLVWCLFNAKLWESPCSVSNFICEEIASRQVFSGNESSLCLIVTPECSQHSVICVCFQLFIRHNTTGISRQLFWHSDLEAEVCAWWMQTLTSFVKLLLTVMPYKATVNSFLCLTAFVVEIEYCSQS